MADNTPSILAGREIAVDRPDPSNYANDIRLVTSNAELTKALAELSAGKGGIIELASGMTFKLNAVDSQDRQEDAPVMIRSADPDNPAVLSSVKISERENLVIVDVEIYGTRESIGLNTSMITIQSSDNIGIFDSEIHSNATDAAGLWNDPGADKTIGSSAVLTRGSTDVTFAGNKIYDANHGLALLDNTDVTIVGNEITSMQGDGIRIGGVQDLTIQANWIHDMLGSTTSFNHPDMIQFWGTNILQNTVNVKIEDNILDVGDGPSYQMIFGRNEDFRENGWLFQDIQIENNVIVGGTYHQISIDQTENTIVRNNTVFTQEDAYSLQSDGSKSGHGTGWIKIGGKNATIEKNIALTVHADGDNVKYTMGSGANSSDQNANFVNLSSGGSGDLRDLMLRQDSDWNGVYGSDLLWNNGTSPQLTAVASTSGSSYNQSLIRLDASFSSDASGKLSDAKAKFVWTFDDGSTKTGRTIEHDFVDTGTHGYSLRVKHSDGRVDVIDRSIEIEAHTHFDFELSGGKLVNTVESGGGFHGDAFFGKKGLEISDRHIAEISRGADGITDLDAFNFEMTIEPAKGASGVFLYLHNAVRGEVKSDGSIRYEFKTDDGTFSATTQPGVFNGGSKVLNFVYDGEAETFGIYIDGKLAVETEASGTTLPMASWPLSFGRPWGGTLDATVSSIRLSQEARPGEVVETGPSEPEVVDPEVEEPEVTEPETGTPRDPHDFGEVYASIDFNGDLPKGVSVKEGEVGKGVLNLQDGQVVFDRKAAWIYNADEFDISFDATLLDAGSAGSILYLHNAMSVMARSNGSLSFTLTTDKGTKTIVTDADVLEVGQSQRISIGYDSEASIMQIAVDGEVLVQGEQSGETPPLKYWGLAVGHSWGKDVPNMEIDNFVASEHPDTRLGGGTTSPDLGTGDVVDDREAFIDIDFNVDASNGMVNSAVTSVSRGDPALTKVEGRSVAVFDGNDTVSVTRSSDLLFGRDSFDFDVSLRTVDDGGGTVMQIHKSMSLKIEGDDFVFRMQTDDGQVSVRSQNDILADEKFHSVKVGYDSYEGRLAMSVDGIVVDSTEAHGSTKELEYWGLDIGSPWNASLVAEVDHFRMYDAPNWELSA